MTENVGKRINFGIDMISFIAITAILVNFGKADPGDVIFVFVYESTIMAMVFALFFIIFNTFEYIKENKGISLLNRFFKGMYTSIFASFTVLLVASFFILLLNQITIEFLVAFLKDNAYQFKSIEILSTSGIYLEGETIHKLEQLFGKSYALIFYIIGIKYFINLLINYVSKSNKSKEIRKFAGLYETVSQIIISPIAMLLSCLILVILASIFGPQTWIVFVVLGIFRLLFMFFFSKLNSVLNTL